MVPDVATIADATAVLHRPALVGIDGVDGSGKSTYAAALARAYGAVEREAHVVHLDDFLNPRSVRYRQGRSSPRGFFDDTYDLVRLRRAVIEPLRTREDHCMVPKVFDHRADKPVEVPAVRVSPGSVVIVEGMFLHRDGLRRVWDLSVFLDVPFEVSVARLAERDGTQPDPGHRSMRRYVEGQRIYLRTCRPRERATYVVDNGQPDPLRAPTA